MINYKHNICDVLLIYHHFLSAILNKYTIYNIFVHCLSIRGRFPGYISCIVHISIKKNLYFFTKPDIISII